VLGFFLHPVAPSSLRIFEARAMIRRLLVGFGVVAALGLIGYGLAVALGAGSIDFVGTLMAEVRPPIVVGLIHSQVGPLAISEKSLIDAEVFALEEINARGGVAGRPLKWEIADGRSDAATFASHARRLIEQSKADVLVGGWTAECRKAMLAVVDAKENLLIFPSNYEGIEDSYHVIYTGGSANQVILPGVRWCFDGLKAKKFFVVGTEDVWSRVVAEVAKDAIKSSGGELLGESFLPVVGGDVQALVETIRAAKPDVVLNFLVGDSNVQFYSAMRRAGVTPDKLPVLAFNISEDELKRFPPGDVTGHYSAWNYFQSLDRPENLEFVRRFKARFGDDRVVSDAMVAAYNGLMIWSQAAEEAGTGDPKIVLRQFDRQSFDAAEGIVTIDPDSWVAWRPFHVGKARPDGQFDVVWSITKPIHPVTYVATRSHAQWQALLEELKTRWGGQWSSSEPFHPSPTPPAR
jgi:urea transport system substrate-binding protein